MKPPIPPDAIRPHLLASVSEWMGRKIRDKMNDTTNILPSRMSRDELVDYAGNLGAPMGTIKNVATEGAKRGIQAWHGSSSGKDLTGFSNKFFGKGQGAPKHGMALYTSDAKEVAERYAQNGTPTGKKGLYRVEIDADPDDFLQLDKPFKQQPPQAFERAKQVAMEPLDFMALPRKKLQELLQKVDPDGIWTDAASKREGMKPASLEEMQKAAAGMDLGTYLNARVGSSDDGQYLLRKLEAIHGQKKASQLLEKAGFSGTRYVDPQDQLDKIGKVGAKVADNFAVFNPAKVRILEALGLAGMIGGAYGAGGTPAPVQPQRKGIQPLGGA